MADETPKKRVPLNCFLCDRKRYFNLCGKKLPELVSKVKFITNLDFQAFVDSNKSNSLGICRPCFDCINNSHSFIKKLKDKLSNPLDSTDQRVKRLTVSPITPKIKGDNVSAVKKHSSARRPLSLWPDTHISVDNSDTDVISGSSQTESVDHSYCASKKRENVSTPVSTPGIQFLQGHLQNIDLYQDCPVPERSKNPVIEEVLNTIFSNKVILRAVENRILRNIDITCAALSTRTAAFSSVLSKYRDVEKLLQLGENFFHEVIHELSERIPFLLDLLTVIVTGGNEPSDHKVMPIVAAYSILMKARNEKLSAWHRLTTMVAVKGHLDDSALTRFNHLGLMLCTTSKIRLLEEAGESMEKNIAREVVNNPLVKITGDNLDIYIKTGHRSLDRSNKDLHLFASNIIFSRIAKPGIFSTSVRHTPLERIRPEMFFPTGHHRQTLVNSYCVILGRILVTLKEFSWLGPVLPAHIYHPFQVHMSQKSSVYQLPIIMKNEAKHEDCVDILDTYETILSDIYVKAFGSTELLNKFQVPVGGDQLTRVRLEEAKNLRTLATTPQKRFEDLQPFVIELWHTKQDYLEKCYKELFTEKSLRQSGTLYHYKSKLQCKEVNGKVKGLFKTHHEFLLLVGQEMIIEQFLEYFGMESASSSPTKNVPSFKRSLSERRAQMQDMLTDFMKQYGYLEFVHDVRESNDDDYVYNYCCNLCRWVLHLLMFEDIVREGDISRLIPCLMVCLQFFFSHSRLSKYFQEMLDFILKCEFLLSPMQRVRALEGAFTNLRGGMGKNIESDLVQENSVCNQKDLIRSLGANKTDKAILRCTKAADTVEKISSYVDSVASQKKSSKHHVPKAVKDQEIIQRSLRQLRPFNKAPGRSCDGFPKICRSPLKKINKNDFQYRIMQVVSRLYYGQSCSNVNQCSDEDE